MQVAEEQPRQRHEHRNDAMQRVDVTITVLRRRVQASLLVRPRIVSPRGAIRAAKAETKSPEAENNESNKALKPRTNIAMFSRSDRHQRRANVQVDLGK
jgi:hypothetical protein